MIEILTGECRDLLKTLPSNYFHSVVTSPPYLWQRNYQTRRVAWGGDSECDHVWGEVIHYKGSKGVGSQFCTLCGAWLGDLGLEPSPELFALNLAEVFREVWRVLRPDGTFFLNFGDKYCDRKHPWINKQNLIGVPEMVVKALMQPWVSCPSCEKTSHLSRWGVVNFTERYICPICEMSHNKFPKVETDGWNRKNSIVWNKLNIIPESVKTRFTQKYEMIYFLTKKKSGYYFDMDPVREPIAESSKKRAMRGVKGSHKYGDDSYFPPGTNQNTLHEEREHKGYDRMEEAIANGETCLNPRGRNRRAVWKMATSHQKGGHYAAFPEELPEICLQAGASLGGCCGTCGVPKTRLADGLDLGTDLWIPGCSHISDTVPCRVLDPFSGSGTTGLVASRLGFDYTGLELNADHALDSRSLLQSEGQSE